MTDFKVIDSHVHIQPWKMIKPECLALMEGKRPDQAEIAEVMYDPAKLLRLMDKDRIEKICTINYISPEIMGFTEEVNEYAADYAKKCEGRVIPFGSVHPTLSKNPAREMDELIAAGFRGVKMHPSHQPCYPNDYRNGNKTLETIYRKAEEAGLVLMVHTGTSVFPGARNVYADPIYCDDIPLDFPRLKIILAHGGRPLWMDTAIFLLRRYPSMLMDISSLPPQSVQKYFPRLEQMSGQVLWGSDWPAPGVPSMRANVDKFLQLPLSNEAKHRILYDNAAALYGL